MEKTRFGNVVKSRALFLIITAFFLMTLSVYAAHFPVSPLQYMAVAVAISSAGLLSAFNPFFQGLKTSGSYDDLVNKYYPSGFLCNERFFLFRQGGSTL